MGARTSHAAQGRVQGVRCEEDVGGWREDAGAGLWSHWSHTGERMLVSGHTDGGLVTLPGSARSPAG